MWHFPPLEIPSCNVGKQCKVHRATRGNLSVLFQCWKSVVHSWIAQEPHVAIFNDPMWIVQELSVGNTLSNIGNFKGPMLENCCPILAMHQSNVGHYLTNVRNLSPNVGYCNSNLPILEDITLFQHWNTIWNYQ